MSIREFKRVFNYQQMHVFVCHCGEGSADGGFDFLERFERRKALVVLAGGGRELVEAADEGTQLLHDVVFRAEDLLDELDLQALQLALDLLEPDAQRQGGLRLRPRDMAFGRDDVQALGQAAEQFHAAASAAGKHAGDDDER